MKENIIKNIFTLVLILLVFNIGYAQEKHNVVKSSEFEIYSNICGFALNKAEGYNNKAILGNWGFGLKYRHNLKKSPFDIGAELSILRTCNKLDSVDADPMRFAMAHLVFKSNYNYNRGEDVSFFMGAGAGIALSYEGYSMRPCLTPEVGVELFNKFRISTSANWAYKTCNAINFNIGIVFGGGRVGK